MTKTLNDRIADEDRKLRTAVETAGDELSTRTVRLDKHRYACIRHDNGPKIKVTEYAALVGVDHPAISHSVKAVEIGIKAGRIQLDTITVPTDTNEGGGSKGQTATKGEAAGHTESRTQAKHGDERAQSVHALADAFGATPGTVGNGNQPHWKTRLAHCQQRAREIAVADGRDTVRKSDATKAAKEIFAAYELHQKRLARIKTVLVEHRTGLRLKVTKTMVDDLYKHAERLAARLDIDLDQAIADLLESDRKDTEVDRETARLAGLRSYYVREIEQGLSTMVVGGSRVEKAMRDAKGDLDLHDDEIATFAHFMTKVRGALNALDLLVTGQGDWDAAANALIAAEGA
jgi:hypothetical protein